LAVRIRGTGISLIQGIPATPVGSSVALSRMTDAPERTRMIVRFDSMPGDGGDEPSRGLLR
jgi:hypothetical protein